MATSTHSLYLLIQNNHSQLETNLLKYENKERLSDLINNLKSGAFLSDIFDAQTDPNTRINNAIWLNQLQASNLEETLGDIDKQNIATTLSDALPDSYKAATSALKLVFYDFLKDTENLERIDTAIDQYKINDSYWISTIQSGTDDQAVNVFRILDNQTRANLISKNSSTDNKFLSDTALIKLVESNILDAEQTASAFNQLNDSYWISTIQSGTDDQVVDVFRILNNQNRANLISKNSSTDNKFLSDAALIKLAESAILDAEQTVSVFNQLEGDLETKTVEQWLQMQSIVQGFRNGTADESKLIALLKDETALSAEQKIALAASMAKALTAKGLLDLIENEALPLQAIKTISETLANNPKLELLSDAIESALNPQPTISEPAMAPTDEPAIAPKEVSNPLLTSIQHALANAKQTGALFDLFELQGIDLNQYSPDNLTLIYQTWKSTSDWVREFGIQQNLTMGGEKGIWAQVIAELELPELTHDLFQKISLLETYLIFSPSGEAAFASFIEVAKDPKFEFDAVGFLQQTLPLQILKQDPNLASKVEALSVALEQTIETQNIQLQPAIAEPVMMPEPEPQPAMSEPIMAPEPQPTIAEPVMMSEPKPQFAMAEPIMAAEPAPPESGILEENAARIAAKEAAAKLASEEAAKLQVQNELIDIVRSQTSDDIEVVKAFQQLPEYIRLELLSDNMNSANKFLSQRILTELAKEEVLTPNQTAFILGQLDQNHTISLFQQISGEQEIQLIQRWTGSPDFNTNQSNESKLIAVFQDNTALSVDQKITLAASIANVLTTAGLVNLVESHAIPTKALGSITAALQGTDKLSDSLMNAIQSEQLEISRQNEDAAREAAEAAARQSMESQNIGFNQTESSGRIDFDYAPNTSGFSEAGEPLVTMPNMPMNANMKELSLSSQGLYDLAGRTHITMNFQAPSSDAGYHNSLGIYYADANGNPISGSIVYASVKSTPWGGAPQPTELQLNLQDAPSNAVSLGYFIIPNGGNANYGIIQPHTPVTFQEQNGNWIPTVEGVALKGSGSAAFFSDASLNTDGQHLRVGEDGILGWEDLRGLGDQDYNDILISVNVEDTATEYQVSQLFSVIHEIPELQSALEASILESQGTNQDTLTHFMEKASLIEGGTDWILQFRSTLLNADTREVLLDELNHPHPEGILATEQPDLYKTLHADNLAAETPYTDEQLATNILDVIDSDDTLGQSPSDLAFSLFKNLQTSDQSPGISDTVNNGADQTTFFMGLFDGMDASMKTQFIDVLSPEQLSTAQEIETVNKILMDEANNVASKENYTLDRQALLDSLRNITSPLENNTFTDQDNNPALPYTPDLPSTHFDEHNP